MIRNGQFKRPQQVVALCGATILPVALIFLAADLLGLRFNLSPSLPVGIYIVTTEKTELVEFCPAEPYGAFAAARGYRSTGNCPDGASPLMKPVVAHAGDYVEITNEGIFIHGRRLPNTAPLLADTGGRPLNPWPFGTYPVAEGMIWVASTYNPRSYDSRYFGPVPITSVRDHLRPLWIWQ